MTPVSITNAIPGDLVLRAIPMVVDTAALISKGQLQQDCLDMVVADAHDPSVELSRWVEDGTCNTAHTVVWIRKPVGPKGDVISTHPSVGGIVMVHGGSTRPRANTVENILPELASGTAIWLKPDQLGGADGGLVSHWADALGRDGLAADQSDGSAQPKRVQDGIRGRAALEFDGNDYLRVGDLLKSTTTGMLCAVYAVTGANTPLYPRLISSGPATKNDWEAGAFLRPPWGEDNRAVPTDGDVVCTQYSEPRDFGNLEIGRQAGTTKGWFQGRISEIVIAPASSSGAAATKAFLTAKYGFGPLPRVVVDTSRTIQCQQIGGQDGSVDSPQTDGAVTSPTGSSSSPKSDSGCDCGVARSANSPGSLALPAMLAVYIWRSRRRRD
jgi:MYXO-CTERM domain-containing protein